MEVVAVRERFSVKKRKTSFVSRAVERYGRAA
jgi:hypothetical protein